MKKTYITPQVELINDKYSLDDVKDNMYAIIGYVVYAMRNEKVKSNLITKYINEATSYDYGHMLCCSLNEINELNNKTDEDS